ncbi:MAG: leucine-rich repeat protein, partial [Firmicutes bacterium]|nr:leucine-rich repeat protein [Bacillota bacterium]
YNIAMAEDESTASTARQMEYLNRGLIAVDTGSGVYLSWRLLGTESLSNQAFDIYRSSDGTTYTKIKTTGVHDATCYTDTSGSASYTYKVVKTGNDPDDENDVATPLSSSVYTNYTYKSSGLTNQTAYIDIPITAPTPDPANTSAGTDYTYSANDMSVGDLDGDGDYEYIVKWDPSNSKDNSNSGYTGNVYLDAYELDGTLLWRIDLGVNIRAGAHYTQFMVYDFNGDGYAEMACKTAPGSIDGEGNYVTTVGTSSAITSADNSEDYRNSSGYILDGPEYLTIFDGYTGAALQTVYYDPARDITSDWGDNYGGRCDRFLAGVAYLDGETPSLIMCRGYYTYAYIAAYTWDGTNLTEQWLSTNNPSESYATYADGSTKYSTSGYTLYGQGAHSLSVADVDNDEYDEIVFGSAILDHDGTVLLYDGRGHGDAEHVSDFDNDGNQEIFMVHEEGKDNDGASVAYAVDLKRYNGDVLMQATTGDVGRGFMDNALDDTTYGTAQFWSSNVAGVWGYNPNDASNPIEILSDSVSDFTNFGIYWDGDLARELLDDTRLAKVTTSGFARFTWGSSNASWFPNASSNNSSKGNACLVADLFGDWREEVIFRDETDSTLRIFMSCIPTDYRLTTLMHDSQYRCAVAWQNVGYNQPPHTSYYIGSAALASENTTTLNYLDPAVEFTSVVYPSASGDSDSGSSSATAAPITVELTPEADTYIVYDDTNTTHGSDTELKINQAEDKYSDATPGLKNAMGLGLIRFNISDVDPGTELTSATLKLYDKFTANDDKRNSVLHLDYCSDDSWTESTLTSADITIRGLGTPLSSLGLSQSPAYNTSYTEIEFDVTDAVNADEDGIYTFTLWTETAREQVIASKEYTGDDAKVPTLVLEFEPIQYTSEDSFEFDSDSGTITGYIGTDTDVVIPETIDGAAVAEIGDNAFKNAEITSVVFPDALETIGERAFYGSGLTEVTIPDNIISVGLQAFACCDSLATVTIEDCTADDIDGYTFYDDPALESFTVSENNENYCSYDDILFNKDKTTLYRYPEAKADTSYTVTADTIASHAFYGCSNLTSVNIDAVSTVNTSAFVKCDKLPSINIGEGASSISGGFAYNCASLTEFTVDGGNESYVTVDGVLYNIYKTKLVQYPTAKAGTEYTVNASDILQYAFAYTANLETVNITAASDIYFSAFYYTSADTINIGADCDPEVDRNAFYSGNLSKLYIYGDINTVYGIAKTIDVTSTTVYCYSTSDVYADAVDSGKVDYKLLDENDSDDDNDDNDDTDSGDDTDPGDDTDNDNDDNDSGDDSGTGEWEYTIDGIDVDSTDQVSVTYTNVSGTGGVLIVAVYDDNNALIAVKITDMGEAESPAQIPIDTTAAKTVSAYIWKTAESQKPLSAKKTISTSE